MADVKSDNKSNLYAAAMPSLETAAGVRVKTESGWAPSGMDSLKSLQDELNAADKAEINTLVKESRAVKRAEKLAGAFAENARKQKAAEEKAAGGRMDAVVGQPGFVVGAPSIVASKRQIFHRMSPADFTDAMPNPFQLHRLKNLTPKGDLAGQLSIGGTTVSCVTPYVDFKDVKTRVVAVIEASHPACKPQLGQTGFSGDITAYTNTVKAGDQKKYLEQRSFMIPVMAPEAKSVTGVSAAIGITFGFNEAIDALMTPDAEEAKKVRLNLIRILKQNHAVGIQRVIAEDGKEEDQVTVSLMGMCEILAQYDMRTSFQFWYKGAKAPKGAAEFYDSENMVGGVIGAAFTFVLQAILQRESGAPKVAIKPKNDELDIQLQVTHKMMLEFKSRVFELEAELAAAKKESVAQAALYRESERKRAEMSVAGKKVQEVAVRSTQTVKHYESVRAYGKFTSQQDLQAALDNVFKSTHVAAPVARVAATAATPVAAAAPKAAATAAAMGDD